MTMKEFLSFQIGRNFGIKLPVAERRDRLYLVLKQEFPIVSTQDITGALFAALPIPTYSYQGQNEKT